MDEVILKQTRLESVEVHDLLEEWNDELIATVPRFVPGGGSTVDDAVFLAPDGMLLVAGAGQSAVGCGGVRRLDSSTGEIKRLFVRRAFRGCGIGRALLCALERHAHELGYDEVRLDTTGREPRALSLFQRSGYVEIPDYNGNPHARHWFAKRLRAI
jgi:GNAT superfamily N-acetyltransferase